MAETVELLGKLKDEMIKIDLAYRKIESMAKEKKIEDDLVMDFDEVCVISKEHTFWDFFNDFFGFNK